MKRGRDRRENKFRRWCFYFPSKQEVGRPSASQQALREVVQEGRAKIVYTAISNVRVDLEWPAPVTIDSPLRLCHLARTRCPTFHILGDPSGLDELVVDERAREESAGAASAGAASAGAASAGAASAGAALAGAASAGAASTGVASAGVASAGVASAPAPTPRQCQPSFVIGIKIEHAFSALASGEDSGACHCDWDIDLEDVLGTGRWGKVHAAVHTEEVAIKMFDKPDGPRGIRHADEEFKRIAAAGDHPNIVKLLDAGLFRRETLSRHLGLVYERFDGTLAQTVSLPLKWDGVKHVLQSVLAGLAHMHARGVVHTDVSPKNIFLRGAGPHRRAWSRALRRGCISQDSPLADPETKPEVTAAFDAHLPCTFEVGGEATSVGSAPPPRTTRSFEQSVRMNKASNIIRTVGSRDHRGFRDP